MESNLALILPNEGNPISSPQQPIPGENKTAVEKTSRIDAFKKKNEYFWGIVYHYHFLGALIMNTIIEKRAYIRSVGVETKDDFLFDLLHNNERLMSRFEEFVRSYDPGTAHTGRELNLISFEDELMETYEAFSEGLEGLDLPDLFQESLPDQSSSELDENEMFADSIPDSIREFYEAWRTDLSSEIRSGYHFQAIAMIFGMLAATTEFGVFDPQQQAQSSARNHLIFLLKRDLKNLLKNEFEEVTVKDQDVLVISEITFRFAKTHHISVLNYFQPFFEKMVRTPALNTSILEKLKEHSIPLIAVPAVADLLTSRTGDELSWLKAMESIFPDDFDMAIKLLNYYFDRIPEEFEHMAAIAFQQHKMAMVEFLEGKLEPGSKLYCQFWLTRAACTMQLDHYAEARKFITRTEGINFAKEQADFDFKMQLLVSESAWDEILVMASSKQAADQLHALLPHIMPHYPNECFSLIEKNAAHVLKHHRNREGYSKLAEFLKLSREIPGKEEETEELIKTYISTAHKLPAMKDELRNHGFQL